MKHNRINNRDIPLLHVSPLTSAIRKGLVYGSAIAISSTLTATPALAQTSSRDEPAKAQESSLVDATNSGHILEEIIVTAARREVSILDASYAISAISGKDIQRNGIQDLSDLVRVIPGIAYLDQGPRVANNNNYIVIRGLNATNQSGNADTPFLAQPAVSTYFGDIPIFANFQMADLNRVEVLRGPQATLYGSGSLGGTLRLIPNKPDTTETTFEVSADLSATSHSGEPSYDFSAVWNQPLNESSALRFAAGSRHLGGFIDAVARVDPDSNGFPIPTGPTTWLEKPRQKDVNDSTEWYFRAMGSYIVSENTDILLTWQHQDLDADNRQAQSTGFALSDIDEKYVHRVTYEEPLASDMDLFAIDIGINLGFATLSSSSSYTRSDTEWIRDATGLYQNAFYWYTNYYFPYTTTLTTGDSGQEIFAQELRLVSNSTDSNWDYVAGLYYLDQDFVVDELQFIPGLSDFIANDPFTFAVVVPPTDVTWIADRDWNFTELAAFGELTYHISDRWQVTGGARVFRQTYDQLFVFQSPFCPSLYYAPATCGDPGGNGITTTTQLSKNITDSIFKANTSYDITDHSKVYFSFSQGFRHGGANAVPTTGPFPEEEGVYEDYDSDKANNWEIGYKGSVLDGRVSFSLSAFYIDWKNTQFDAFTERFAFSAVANGPDAISKGIEAELSGLLTDNWTYKLGYNFTRSEWDVDGAVGAQPLFKGDQLPGVPKHMASFSTDYYLPVSFGGEQLWVADFHMDAFYRSSATTSPNIIWGNFEVLDDFSVWNIAIDLQGKKWSLRAYIDNVFSEVGITGGELESDYLSYAFRFVQRPRTTGLRMKYKFK